MRRKGRRSPSAREVAAEVVAKVLDEDAFVGLALDAALSQKAAALSPKDRAFATELVYGTLRWARPLEESLLRASDKPKRGLEKRIRPHLLVAAYQLQHLKGRVPPHAAVKEAVAAIRRVRPGLAGFANALLRNLGSPPYEQLPSGASADVIARALGIPPVLTRATLRGLPEEEHAAALFALNERAPLGLTYLGPPDEEEAFLSRLLEAAAEVRRHRFVPHSTLVEGAGAVEALPGFSEGWIQVQDPGSLLVALLVGARPGMRVVDLCAAPGGKSMVLASRVGPEGCVIAVEKDERRARRIEENAGRTGRRVDVIVADVLELGPERAFGEGADAVLLDAPCTGYGTVRKRPDIKLKKAQEDALRCADLQGALLEAASRHVREGGALVYAVCSPLPEEGPDVVDRFLERNPAFTIEPAKAELPFLPDDALDEKGRVRLLTHRHQTDAFFAVRLTRRGPEATP